MKCVFCLIVALILQCYSEDIGVLKSVVVLFRHGDRNIITSYPTDPYKDVSNWPGGFGELTNEGKRKHYALGKWFRNRYRKFLPEDYSRNDIHVQSTDVDRCLMSAASHLAGLYPPRGEAVWDPLLNWQPIPIHTTPFTEDPVLAMMKYCRKHDTLMTELLNSTEFVNLNHELNELYLYASEYSGKNISTLWDILLLYDTLNVEISKGYTLPSWTDNIFPDILEKMAVSSLNVFAYNMQLARLKTGPFLHEVISNFRSLIENGDGTVQKYRLYFAHDYTIINVMKALNAFNGILPAYSSAVIFELRQLNYHQYTHLTSSQKYDNYYVNVIYKNSTKPYEIIVHNCEFNCKFNSFVEYLKPVTVDLKTWEEECNNT